MLKNKIFGVEGYMGTGKTLFTTILALSYNEVYANYGLITNGSNVEKVVKITKYDDINRILKQKQLELKNGKILKKSLLIIDEAQKLFNKRLSMTKNNRILNDFTVLSRKCNMDICLIAQQINTLDKQQIPFLKVVFSCIKSYSVYNQFTQEQDVNVELKIKKQNGEGKLNTINHKSTITNCIYIMKKGGVGYDTTDTAVLE